MNDPPSLYNFVSIHNPNTLEQFEKHQYLSNDGISKNNPSNKTGKKEYFEEINLFRGFSIFLIVWMHIMSCMLQQDLKVKNSWTYLEKIINTLFSGGTAYFMFISGILFYLVFYKRGFNQKKFFFSKLKKVFFPYLVCSLVLLLVHFFVTGTNHLNSNFILYKGFFYWSLWYVPTIMVLFFFSPCFVFFIEKTEKVRIVIFLFFILFSFFLGRHNTNPILSATYWCSYYLLGILTGIYYLRIKNASEQVIFNLIAIITILVALLVGTGNIYIPDYNTWEISMDRLSWPTFLKFGLAILFLILAQKFLNHVNNNSFLLCCKKTLDFFASYSFTIFFYHNLVILFFLNYKIPFFSSLRNPLSYFVFIALSLVSCNFNWFVFMR